MNHDNPIENASTLPAATAVDAGDASALTEDLAAFKAWLQARKYSPATIKSWTHSAGCFSKFIERHQVLRFQDVTPEHCDQYLADLRNRQIKDSSVGTYGLAMRRLFAFLVKTLRIFNDPTVGLTIHKPYPKIPQVIAVEEVYRLLNMPDCSTPLGLRDRAIMEVLYATGMRSAELLGLTVFSVDVGSKTVLVEGKGSKERVLPLSTHAVRFLKQYLRLARPKLIDPQKPPMNALWISDKHRPLGRDGIQIAIRKYARQAGLKTSVSPHTFRRTCATHLLRNGANPAIVSELLGHADLGTLSSYLRITLHDLKRMHKGSKPGS